MGAGPTDVIACGDALGRRFESVFTHHLPADMT